MLIDVRNHWLVCKSSHYVQAEALIIMSSVLFQFCEKRICDTDPYPLPQNVMSLSVVLSVVLLESLIVRDAMKLQAQIGDFFSPSRKRTDAPSFCIYMAKHATREHHSYKLLYSLVCPGPQINVSTASRRLQELAGFSSHMHRYTKACLSAWLEAVTT